MGGFPIFKIAKWGGWAKNKIVGGSKVVGGQKLWRGAKKFLVMFAKMHHFKEKIGNFSKIFACGGLLLRISQICILTTSSEHTILPENTLYMTPKKSRKNWTYIWGVAEKNCGVGSHSGGVENCGGVDPRMKLCQRRRPSTS